MAITFIGSTYNAPGGTSPVSTAPYSLTAGNDVVVLVRVGNTADATVIDSALNTYALQPTKQDLVTAGDRIEWFLATNVSANAADVFTGTSAGNSIRLYVIEFHTTIAHLGVDLHPTGVNATGTTADPGNMTTTVAASVLLAMCGLGAADQTITKATGYTQLNSGASQRAGFAYQIVAATGTYDGSFTLGASVEYAALQASLSEGGGGAPPDDWWDLTSWPGFQPLITH